MHRRLEQLPKDVMQKHAKRFKNHGTQKLKFKTCFHKLQKQKHVFLKINYPKLKNEVIENYICKKTGYTKRIHLKRNLKFKGQNIN